MFLVAGANANVLAALLREHGDVPGEVGKPETLESPEALRSFRAVVIDGLSPWPARVVNALWETDSFVVLFGKLPPQLQIFAGVELRGNERVKSAGRIVVERPDALPGLEGPLEVRRPVPMLWRTAAPGGESLLCLETPQGDRHPLLTRRGRVAYGPVSPTLLKDDAKALLLDAVFAWLGAQAEQTGLDPTRGPNTVPGFAAVQSCIPAREKGPNARNYSYLLRRVTRLLAVLARYSAHKHLRGKTVLDIGCGFGTTTVVGKALTGFKRVLGIDIDQRLVDIGNDVARQLDLNVEFRVGDMLDLGALQGEFDIVICNNAFNYFRNSREMRFALEQFHQALKPGGAFITLTPSRLGAIEAFTKYPGLQFLPRSLAAEIIREDGLSSVDYRTIKLPSPFEVIHWMRDVGYEDIHAVDPYTLSECNIPSLFKPRFYVVGSRPN